MRSSTAVKKLSSCLLVILFMILIIGCERINIPVFEKKGSVTVSPDGVEYEGCAYRGWSYRDHKDLKLVGVTEKSLGYIPTRTIPI